MVILNVLFRWTMVLGSLILSSHCFSQTNEYSFEQIDSLQKQNERPIVVFIHTDWCGYCNMMSRSTFNNKEVASLLNENYYFTQLNAESKEDIFFAGHTFKFTPTGYNTGVHELASALANIDGKTSYPTVTILNPQNEIIFQYGGYLDAKSLLKVLKEYN